MFCGLQLEVEIVGGFVVVVVCFVLFCFVCLFLFVYVLILCVYLKLFLSLLFTAALNVNCVLCGPAVICEQILIHMEDIRINKKSDCSKDPYFALVRGLFFKVLYRINHHKYVGKLESSIYVILMKYTFNIGLRLDTVFKLSIMLDAN